MNLLNLGWASENAVNNVAFHHAAPLLQGEDKRTYIHPQTLRTIAGWGLAAVSVAWFSFCLCGSAKLQWQMAGTYCHICYLSEWPAVCTLSYRQPQRASSCPFLFPHTCHPTWTQEQPIFIWKFPQKRIVLQSYHDRKQYFDSSANMSILFVAIVVVMLYAIKFTSNRPPGVHCCGIIIWKCVTYVIFFFCPYNQYQFLSASRLNQMLWSFDEPPWSKYHVWITQGKPEKCNSFNLCDSP